MPNLSRRKFAQLAISGLASGYALLNSTGSVAANSIMNSIQFDADFDGGLDFFRYWVNVTQFGAVPDVQIDQSVKLQQAFNEAAISGKTVIIDRIYWIKPKLVHYSSTESRWVGIQIPDNCNAAWLGNGAIKLLPVSDAEGSGTFYALNFYGSHNVKLYKPSVYGDRNSHLGTLGESGNNFNIVNCSDIYIFKPFSYNSWGDGYYVGIEYWGEKRNHATNVTLISPYSLNSGRNGLSLVSGENIYIKKPVNEGLARTAPGAGIDIEFESGNNTPLCKNIVVEAPFSRNRTTGLKLHNTFLSQQNTAVDIDVRITGTAWDESSGAAFSFTSHTHSTGIVYVENLKSINSVETPFYIEWLDHGPSLSIQNVNLENGNVNFPAADYGFGLHIRLPRAPNPAYHSNGQLKALGNFRIHNMEVRDTRTPKKIIYPIKVTSINNIPLNNTHIYIKRSSNITSPAIVYTGINANCNFDLYAQITYYNMPHRLACASELNMFVTTPDGITLWLDETVKLASTFRKSDSTGWPVKLVSSPLQRIRDGNKTFTHYQSTTPGSSVTIYDSGTEKVIQSKTGSWVGWNE